MGESSTGDANFVKDDLLDWSEDRTLIEQFLKEAPFEELCGDGMVFGIARSIEHIDPICTTSLDFTPISSPLLPTTPSHLHSLHEPLGGLRAYSLSFDPYCVYLKEMPSKIVWTTFFDYSFNFSMAYDKCKRALTFFAVILIVFSCSHHFEIHKNAYSNLL